MYYLDHFLDDFESSANFKGESMALAAGAAHEMRPAPILLHACKDFAVFSIRKKPEKLTINIADMIRTSTATGCCANAPSNHLTTLCESCSSLSSSDSGDSSLCYRSPAIHCGQMGSGVKGEPNDCDIAPLLNFDFLTGPNNNNNNLSAGGAVGRSRSHSECGERSPLKGILKRRPMSRSFSECQDGNDPFIAKNYVIPRLDCSFGMDDQCCSIGDSISQYLDETGVDLSTSPFNNFLNNKKSVTFSERVEENIFRPDSIILGQRNKKAARKPKPRKRRGSSSGDDNNNENSAFAADAEESESAGGESGQSSAALNNNNKNNPKCKTQKKKKSKDQQQQIAPIDLNSDKYRGFVISATAAQHHQQTARRLSSTDSAVSVTSFDNAADDVIIDNDDDDDDDVTDNDDVINADVQNCIDVVQNCDDVFRARYDVVRDPDDVFDDVIDNPRRISSVSGPDFSERSSKDSSVDDDLELERLCVRMCEAVVSGPEDL